MSDKNVKSVDSVKFSEQTNSTPTRKGKIYWQKLSRSIKTAGHIGRILPLEFERTDPNETTGGTFLDIFSRWQHIRPEGDKQPASDFTFAQGIPIKDSEKDTFSSGIVSKVVINPEGNVIVVWLGLVTLGWVYFAWSLIAREAFKQLEDVMKWDILDYVFNGVFLFDMFIKLLTGFLEDGLLVTDKKILAKHYMFSRWFIVDVISILPPSWSIFKFGSPIQQFTRLFKIFRAQEFVRKVEWSVFYPTALRVFILSHTLILLIHWFACAYFMVSVSESSSQDGVHGWAYPINANGSEWNTLTRKYLHSLYWACLTLTTIGDKKSPDTNLEYIYTMVAYFLGIFVFATVVGQVGNVISARNENNQQYRKMMDHAKKFMATNNIRKPLQKRVLRWYRFSRSRGTLTGDNDVNSLQMLPDSLKTELAIAVNINTLRQVDLFRAVQPEFLNHLVLKMKSNIYTPNDMICRRGEVGKEMFIVNHGLLEVISKTGVVVARLKTGDFFGEIGILNLNKGINKRVADVRSVGFSEVFILSAKDMHEAMDFYPEAKAVLLEFGRKRLQNTRKQADSNSEKSEQHSTEETEKIPVAEENLKSKMTSIQTMATSSLSIVGRSQTKGRISSKKSEEDSDRSQETTDVPEEENSDNTDQLELTSKLNRLVQALSSIVDQLKHSAPPCDMTLQQQEMIKQQQSEIDLLHSEVKSLKKNMETNGMDRSQSA